jgi:hypothetical protein
MVSVIVFFSAAATPTRLAPSAPADAVAISAIKMPVEATGGANVAGNGRPAPGEAQVGLIRYE